MQISLGDGTINIQDTLDMAQSGGDVPLLYGSLDYNGGVDLNCVMGAVDPITGDSIASCGGVGPVQISNPPNCMVGDQLVYSNGYWMCGQAPVSGGGGGVLSGMPSWALPAAVLIGALVLLKGR